MKPRTVIVTLETESSTKLERLKNLAWWKTLTGPLVGVRQVTVAVVDATKKHKKENALRGRGKKGGGRSARCA